MMKIILGGSFFDIINFKNFEAKKVLGFIVRRKFMIEVKNLRKVYTDGNETFEAIRDISLKVEKGEIYGFIGLSGAGKTTLVRCISTLVPLTSGEILVDGIKVENYDEITKKSKQQKKEDVKALQVAREKLGLVFQHFNLLNNATVYNNVAFPLQIKKVDKAEIDLRVKGILELVGLTDKIDVYPKQLSGGQKQRVGIARALITNPSILICDEATSALDPQTTKSILELIKDINKKLGITVLIITHEMDVIKQICDKVAILEDGVVVEAGNTLELYTNPKSETAKNFFAYETNTTKEHFVGGKVIRLTYCNEDIDDPIIYRIIKEYNTELSILSGTIENINGSTVGKLTVRLTGLDSEIGTVIAQLEKNNVKCEVIKGE